MNETNDHAIVPITPSSPATSSRAIITAEALKEDKEQRALLSQYVKDHMVLGEDYGEIPGVKRRGLLKPGAEKLVELYRCTPEFKLVKSRECFIGGKGFFAYMFRVRLKQRDIGAVVAEGYGSANSMEGKWRWRQASRRCPKCDMETIIKGKEEYGGGWLCFGKKGGCGAKFLDGDGAIEDQKQGRVENDDIASYANTILKMAKKRALVDGAIAVARCSDLFTQDVDDLQDLEAGERTKLPAPRAAADRPDGRSVVVVKPTDEAIEHEMDGLAVSIREEAETLGISEAKISKGLSSLKSLNQAKRWLAQLVEMRKKSESSGPGSDKASRLTAGANM